jgi:hypothetical protein
MYTSPLCFLVGALDEGSFTFFSCSCLLEGLEKFGEDFRFGGVAAVGCDFGTELLELVERTRVVLSTKVWLVRCVGSDQWLVQIRIVHLLVLWFCHLGFLFLLSWF